MLTGIILIVCSIIFWMLVAYGFRLGKRNTAAAERTSAILEAALPPEKLQRVLEIEAQRKEAAFAHRQRCVIAVCAVVGVIVAYNWATHSGGNLASEYYMTKPATGCPPGWHDSLTITTMCINDKDK